MVDKSLLESGVDADASRSRFVMTDVGEGGLEGGDGVVGGGDEGRDNDDDAFGTGM